MTIELSHEELVRNLGLLIEKDKRYSLVKYFVSWGDQKTDLIGPYYPDVTCLRREGRTKIMVEVETAYSFEDPDEVRRLEALSAYCEANKWEFYIACSDERTLSATKDKVYGRHIKPKDIWLTTAVPFQTDETIKDSN